MCIKYKSFLSGGKEKQVALPETNIASENGWLEYKFPCGRPVFKCYVSFRG